MLRAVVLAAALMVTLATAGWADEAITGHVVRVEQPVGVVVLDDGRIFQITDETLIMVKDQDVDLSDVQDGDDVTLESAQPVEFRDGQYVLIIPEDENSPSVLPGAAD